MWQTTEAFHERMVQLALKVVKEGEIYKEPIYGFLEVGFRLGEYRVCRNSCGFIWLKSDDLKVHYCLHAPFDRQIKEQNPEVAKVVRLFRGRIR
jgi:hypothetical protein